MLIYINQKKINNHNGVLKGLIIYSNMLEISLKTV